MNLTDREILELNELCGAVVDGVLGDAQRRRLAGLLRESEAARRFYVRAIGQSASLHVYAAEMHAEAPDQRERARPVVRLPWWALGFLAAAAAVTFAFWIARLRPANPDRPPDEPRATQFVARLTGARDAQWTAGTAPLQPGAHLHRGQRLELNAGYAEVTFDSGARVVLEGAALLDINSAWDATLRRGTLKTSVPSEAIGFRISNPVVDIVDLGTEFTMIADGLGSAEVLVLKGEVEAAPRSAAEQETILLRENESRRFAQSGVSDVSDRSAAQW